MSGIMDRAIANNTFCGAKNSQYKFALNSTVGYKSSCYINQRLYYFGFSFCNDLLSHFWERGGGEGGIDLDMIHVFL